MKSESQTTSEWQEGYEAGLEAAAIWFQNHRPTLISRSSKWSTKYVTDWVIKEQSGNPWQSVVAEEIRRLKHVGQTSNHTKNRTKNRTKETRISARTNEED